MTRTEMTFCRLCGAGCGMIATIDSADRLISLQADRENALTRGYACYKGLNFFNAHSSPNRLLKPLKRGSDGQLHEIGSETALDEIAQRIGEIIDRHGPQAVGMFVGNGTVAGFLTFAMHRAFLDAIGSIQRFSTITIDQSAKYVSFERMGGWAGGAIQLETADVVMFVGTNPLVSHGAINSLTLDPVKRLKDARARGTQVIVIDPRRTETAQNADLFLQPLPGQDVAIAGALLHTILAEGWFDVDFCERFVGAERMADLRAAVEIITADFAEKRAGLQPGDIRRAASLFAHECKRGIVITATGPNFAEFSNLSQHLYDCINVICGRFPRAGEKVEAIDVLAPPPAFFEEVIPAPRSWEHHAPSRIRGVGILGDERLTGTLADEILTPGDGQIRALIVSGGNPANSIPDQAKITAALESLELLVVIDPNMTVTAGYADFVLPPKLIYERPDLPISYPGFPLLPMPWSQYTPAIVQPPAGSDVVDDWYPLWAIAKRLGKQVVFWGQELDMSRPPTSDELIEKRMAGALVPLEEITKFTRGAVFDVGEFFVAPGRDGNEARFDVMPDDVAAELVAAMAKVPDAAFSHLLISRRSRDFFNSNGLHWDHMRKRHAYNPACLSPAEMTALGLADGDEVEIVSGHGKVRTIVKSDATLRDGVVSLVHGWGGAFNDKSDPRAVGTNINPLISDREQIEGVNAMPRMTGIPVNIKRIASA